MTLSDMAAAICEKINMQQTVDLTACKAWLVRRHELLWKSALWKDSLIAYTQTLSPTGYAPTATWLPSKGTLLCPPILEQVLAVRTTEHHLNVQRQDYYYRIDYDAFNEQGNPREFVLLPACVWEFDTPTLIRVNNATGDEAAATILDVLDSDGISVTRTSLGDEGELTTERIDAATKGATVGTTVIGTPGSSIFSNLYGEAVTVKTTKDGIQTTQGNAPANGTLTLTGRFDSIVASWPVGDPYAATQYIVEGGQAFVGTITLAADHSVMTQESNVAVTPVVSATASVKAFPKRERVRFLNLPNIELTVRVLGKRTTPDFTGDNDEPAIAGFTNCLLAIVLYDMLQRARRYGQAGAAKEEATALLDELKTTETVRQAHSQRLVPEEGYQGYYDFHTAGWAPFPF